MRIFFEAYGYFKDYFTGCRNIWDLPEGATVADLFAAIDASFGEYLPASFWSREKRGFRGPVLVAVDQDIIRDFSQTLCDGQKVSVTRFLIGG